MEVIAVRAAVIVVIDQITKYFIVQKFTLHETLQITSFFNLVYVRNAGAAFSMLADAGGWQLMANRMQPDESS